MFKLVVRHCLRQYQVEIEIDRERCNLIGPEGLIIHPIVWPAGLHPGCTVDIVLWCDQEPQPQPQPQEQGDAALREDLGRREVDAHDRERDARDRERDARERERDARDRERDAQERERDARDREQNAQQRQQPPPVPFPPPGQQLQSPSSPAVSPTPTLASSGFMQPVRGRGKGCNLNQIRKHRASLSFFAGQSRLCDLGKRDRPPSGP